jgi:hypothetical protein
MFLGSCFFEGLLTVEQQYGADSVYGLTDQLDNDRYNAYGFDSTGRNGTNGNGTSGSTALYHHNGSRYGLGRGGGPDSKMNGLHGPKHKRGDMDREFWFGLFNVSRDTDDGVSRSQSIRWYSS